MENVIGKRFRGFGNRDYVVKVLSLGEDGWHKAVVISNTAGTGYHPIGSIVFVAVDNFELLLDFKDYYKKVV